MVRKAVLEDLSAIEGVYRGAREFMRQTGNPNQWGNTHPVSSILIEDIRIGRLYVVERECGICGVFMFECGEDPTYLAIDGAWRNHSPYGVIHRVAGKAEERGVFGEVFAFARERISHLRIDTHRDNKVMQSVLDKYGFVPCGIIYLANGDPRIAYEYIEKNPSFS